MFNLNGGNEEEEERTVHVPYHWPMEVGFSENHILVKISFINTNFSLLREYHKSLCIINEENWEFGMIVIKCMLWKKKES
jgi:hypothetical protein